MSISFLFRPTANGFTVGRCNCDQKRPVILDSRDDAEIALERNGFGHYDEDKQAQEFIVKPSSPFRVSLDGVLPIYSSSEYWTSE
jgi:hypothetical protein